MRQRRRRPLSEVVRRRRATQALSALQDAAGLLAAVGRLDLDGLDPAWREPIGEALADAALEVVGRALSIARQAGATGVALVLDEAAEG